MGWLTTSIESVTSAAYDRSKATTETIYQQTYSKLWYTDERPDAEQQQAQLDHEMVETGLSQEDRETFEKLSQKQMGQWINDLPHHDRLELLGNDEFMQEHWPKARDGIKANETLETKFGLNEGQHTKEGPNGEACLHHEYLGPVTTVPYTPEVTETIGRSAKRDEKGVAELSPGGQGKVGGGTTESETATAKRTEKRKGTVEVCKNDPNDCPTSLSAFFYEANRRHTNVRDKTSSMSDRLDAAPQEYIDAGSEETTEIAATHTQDGNEDGLMNYDEGTEEHTNPTTEATENATEETTAQPDRSAPANQSETEDAQETDASHTEDSDDGLMEYDDGSIEHERRETDNDATGTANDESTDKDLDESGLSL